MRTAVRDPVELCRLLRLPPEWETEAIRGAGQFPVFAPRGFVARMRPGEPHDPLLRQVLPLASEADQVEGFSADPVQDRKATLLPGLIQKYHGRVLLITTGACAVHCRYCFRRHFPYASAPRSPTAWHPALAHIRSDATIREVILSGGDPLTLVDEQLQALVEQLASIDHVRTVRVHTRLPIMIPERVTDQLLGWLCGTRLTPVVVVHANHPAELDREVGDALLRIVRAGVPVLNQAVLLRGVNDKTATLEELCLRLVDHRVMPYYLHQFDRVQGAAHFEVPLPRACQLVRDLRARLPGYAVPQFVREVPGEPSKRVLA
jgi:EF-P beta-lysylation protein EpmB